MRAGPELLAELLRDVVVDGKCVIFLAADEKMAEKMAARYVRAVGDKGGTTKPGVNNPCFVKVGKSAWILFHAAQDLDPGDIARADYVYWPTEGLDYERVTFPDWRTLRPQSPWRPLSVRVEEETEPGAPKSAYDIILG